MFRTLLFICTSTALLWAQPMDEIVHHLVPHTVDPASNGMGRVSLAGPISSNSMFFNPSLIALMDSAQFCLGGRGHYGFISDEYKDDLADASDTDEEYGFLPSGKYTHGSGAVPFTIDLPVFPLSIAGGLGYHNAYDFSIARYSDIKGDNFRFESETKYYGGLSFLNIGLGFGIGSYGAFGVTFNPSIGSRIKIIENKETKSSGSTVKDELEGEMPLKAFFVNFGFTGRPFQNTAAGTMTLGMMVRPGFTIEANEYEYTSETTSGGNTTIDEEYMDVDMEINVPALFGFGMQWQITPVFTWAAEIQTRSFENLEIELGSSVTESGLDNGIAFRTGFEVKVGPVPLRTGFFFEHIVLGEENDSKTLTGMLYDDSPVGMLGGNLGVGIPIKIVRLDIGLTYAFLNKEDKRRPPDASSSASLRKFKYQEHHLLFNSGLVIDIPAPRFTASGSTTKPAPASQPVQLQQQAPVTRPYNTTPAYEPGASETWTPSTEQSTTSDTPTGRYVRIITTSGIEYTGTLVKETEMYYQVNMGDGVQIKILKDKVQSIE